MMQSGFDAVISEGLGRDAICHGAAGSGFAVSLLSLMGREAPDDPNKLARSRNSQGLNLLDFSVVSDARPAHPRVNDAAEITRYIAAEASHSGVFVGNVIVRTGARTGAAAELRRIA